MAGALPAYDIGDELGRGAFGIVFAGRHRTLGRPVAIKQLPRALAADPAVRERFLHEARVVAGLDHPHIAPVYDFVERDGLCLLVMEHLPGGTLADRARAGALDQRAACAAVAAVAVALQHAHRRGVLHRDVKPENVLFGADDVPKLVDFGIAKVLDSDARLTATGTVIGTPAYLAPEVVRGDAIGPAADVYSCGVMLYELLAGRLPFPPRTTATGVLLQHLNDPPPPLLEVAPQVPAAVAEVTMRALEKDPTQRYESAGAFGRALVAAAAASWPGGVQGDAITIVSLAELDTAEVALDATIAPRATSGGVAAPVPLAATDRDLQPTIAPRGLAAAPATQDAGATSSPRRWVAAVAIAALVAVVAGLVGFLALGGDDGGDLATEVGAAAEDDTTPTTGPAEAATTAATETTTASSPTATSATATSATASSATTSSSAATTPVPGTGPTVTGPMAVAIDRARDGCTSQGFTAEQCTCLVNGLALTLGPSEYANALEALSEGRPPRNQKAVPVYTRCGVI